MLDVDFEDVVKFEHSSLDTVFSASVSAITAVLGSGALGISNNDSAGDLGLDTS